MNALLALTLFAIALAERSARLRFEPARFLRRHFASDLLYLASGAVALGLALRRAGEAAAAGFGALVPGLGALPAPVSVLLATVLYDLGAYLTHLLLHRVDLLWRFHEVHHSSPHLDWLATFRAHVAEHALRHLLSPVALLLLGLPAASVAAAGAIYTAWAALNHANLRAELRFLEPLLITPRLHRLHHVPATSGRNLGTLFSLWDRMRGTLVADPDAALRPLGVPGAVATYPQTWLPQLLEPLRRRTPRVAGVAIRSGPEAGATRTSSAISSPAARRATSSSTSCGTAVGWRSSPI
jgi:sterol desaturase/sphingolipid hydroxylase (fatty acid hydroxylase superfamily)